MGDQFYSITFLSQVGWDILYLFTSFYFYLISGYLLFDTVHWLAHRSHNSSYRVLRWFSKTHAIHHFYFNRKLKYNNSYRVANLLSHAPLELICQLLGCMTSWKLVQLFGPTMMLCPKGFDVLPVVALMVKLTVFVVRDLGVDDNHVSYTHVVPKDPNILHVGPEFHALHHVDPNNYFGSWLRILDWIIGTAATIKNRNVTVLSSGDMVGQALQHELVLDEIKSIRSPRFGVDWTYGDSAKLKPLLEDTDILIIACTGRNETSPGTTSDQFTSTIIDLFKRTRRQKPGPTLLPEVWHVGTKTDLFKRPTAAQSLGSQLAKSNLCPEVQAYFDDEAFLYRCIISSTAERPDAALAWLTSKIVLFWIRRGATYIPVDCFDLVIKIPGLWAKLQSMRGLSLPTILGYCIGTVRDLIDLGRPHKFD